MIATVLAALAQLAFLGVLLGLLQWCFPNRAEQPVLRPQFKTDLAFFFGQHLVWLSVELAGLVGVASLVGGVIPSQGFRAQPWLLQALEVVLAGDLVVYWFHRLSHQLPFLWTFHKVHHSSPQLDWLAAHREHPIDGFLTQLAMNLPAILLGVSLTGLAGLIVFRGLWAAFIHSNVRLPLGPLRVLVGAPELHHWHHLSTERTVHNFANLAPWTDLLFGTYHCPKHQHFPLGLPGEPVKSYLGWVLAPWSSGTSGKGSSTRQRDRSATTESVSTEPSGYTTSTTARSLSREVSRISEGSGVVSVVQTSRTSNGL
jgi:sterol desaturase/sphingolipid hydroxylase (fatty acid hydroxylase superfamily)